MIEWISNNKDWIFSGIGVVFLTTIVGIAKRKANFKLKFNFYVLVFIAFTIWIGLDYFLNFDGDYRLKIFLFGLTIIFTFLSDIAIQKAKRFVQVRNAVNKLSLSDCEYVIKCYQGTEYFYFDLTNHMAFKEKWKHILYIPTGSQIALYEPYKICVNNLAYKFVKRRLDGKKA